jgi:SdrD B-like domain
MEKRIMSQDVGQTELQAQTEQLLDGPLKHARAAALAAALLPLASVAVTPASAQGGLCASAGVQGLVWHDVNNNGIQDLGEPGIANAVVSAVEWELPIATDEFGIYQSWVGPNHVAVQIPPGTQPSPSNVGDDGLDSDGVADGVGNSVAPVDDTCRADFGFWIPPVAAPGTGTPGYWKNHPEAWPVEQITVGGVTYTKAQAIAWLNLVGKDKTITMFSSLVPAKLNLLIGNDGSCVSSTIAAADSWMMTYGPVGRGVSAASLAWKIGEPLHRQMDNYNNGMLCAPHRD